MCQFQLGLSMSKDHTVMGKVNDIVSLGAVVMVPVEGKIIPRPDLYCLGIGVVTKNIAPDVDRGEVLDGRVVVAARGRAVVGRAADADIGALVDAVDPDALTSQKSAMSKQKRKKSLTQIKVWAETSSIFDSAAMAAVSRLWLLILNGNAAKGKQDVKDTDS